MAANRILADANVVLDWLLDRAPWSASAAPLWESQDAGRSELCLAASMLDTIYYIIRKGTDFAVAKHAVERCVSTLTILPVDLEVIQRALALPGNDFEDNIAVACALIHSCELIATRDPAGFKHSPVVAIDPSDVERYLQAEKQ
jgi:predicted nucleic acid-binding protein